MSAAQQAANTHIKARCVPKDAKRTKNLMLTRKSFFLTIWQFLANQPPQLPFLGEQHIKNPAHLKEVCRMYPIYYAGCILYI